MRKPVVFLCLGIALLALTSCSIGLREFTYSGSGVTINSASALVKGEITVSDYGRLDRVKRIKINGLTYSPADGLEIVLQTPAGKINLVDKEGGAAEYNGNYEFVELGDESGLNKLVKYNPGSGEIIVPETYQANDNFNPGNDEVKGFWSLIIYNTGGANGSITSWEVTVSVDTLG